MMSMVFTTINLRRMLLVGALIAASTPAHANFILNGSFESGNGGNIYAGSNLIPNWDVVGQAVDHVGNTYWNASDGVKSVDLDGSARVSPGGPYMYGGVAQAFATEVGRAYRVTFDLAGNPATGPVDKQVEVSAAGQSAIFTYRVTIGLPPPWTLLYATETFDFTASAASTTLMFRSLTYLTGLTGWGPVIDNVRAEGIEDPPPASVPEPGTLALLGLGLAGLGLSRRRRAD